ncbi:MAG TPA: alpha-galactosidase [Chloroflexota bacterium]|nr:alpha-galactosidase [Chloroflexota bacterium]
MARIVHIGAGSAGFGKRFLADVLTRPSLRDSTLVLMDVDPDNLDVMATLARRLKEQLDSPVRIEATTDRRRALDGADYVIITIVSNGFGPRYREVDIPRKYGVHHSVGCTSGPSGIFRGLRYVPVLLEICRDVQELCPGAWILDYSNPTSIVPWAITRATGTRFIGLCHSVQHTAMTLARYLGAPYEETGHWVAGINHQAWFLRFEWRGQDAYPLLREKMADPAVYAQDMVRFAMMDFFGYFLTESSYHNAEYVPYFRKNADLIERWTPPVGGWAQGPIERHEEGAGRRRENLRREAYGDGPIQIDPGHEYCISIVDAIESNIPTRINANVSNTGLITNLPAGSCVEVPCLVDNTGIHPCYVGDLPPQCAGVNRARQNQDELAVKGALEGDRKAVEQAIALDPLTASVCTLEQIRAMVAELFEADAPYLPQFAPLGRT